MRPTIRTTILRACALISVLGVLMPARAETYPDHTIKFVAPTTPARRPTSWPASWRRGCQRYSSSRSWWKTSRAPSSRWGLEYIAIRAPADGYTVGVIGIDGQGADAAHAQELAVRPAQGSHADRRARRSEVYLLSVSHHVAAEELQGEV